MFGTEMMLLRELFFDMYGRDYGLPHLHVFQLPSTLPFCILETIKLKTIFHENCHC